MTRRRLWLLPWIAPRAAGLSLVTLLMLGSVAIQVLKPWPMKLLIDNALCGQPLSAECRWIAALPGGGSRAALVAWLALATVLVFAAGAAVQALQEYVRAGVGGRMAYDLAASLFDHLQRLSLRFHQRRGAGDLVRRVTVDSRAIRELVMGVIVMAFGAVVTLVAMFVVMWQLDHWLSLVSMLVVVPLGLAIKHFLRPIMEKTYKQQQLEGEILAQAERTLTALPIVQAFGSEEREDARFRELTGRTLSAYLRALVSQLQFSAGVSGTTAVGTAVLMILGGFHVLDGTLSVGSLVVFLTYLSAFYAPLEELAHLSSGFATATAGLHRVREVLDDGDVVRECANPIALPALPGQRRGHIGLENVVFGYETDRPVLDHISLEARPGQIVALVGHTGAGKSTLVSLIPRLFDPWEGRVTLDGVDVRQLRLASLRAEVALVLQDPFLLPLSIAENIGFGRPDASRDQVVAAAVAANADGFIRKLPQEYDTIIGQRGATLSGGEKQRLAIARALLKDAPVLILDEPTSALDAQTEASLMEAVYRLIANRTTFIIAHRLSTVRRADQIFVLDHGRIVEAGTHHELLRIGGVYWTLYETQFGTAMATNVGART